jgi:hypothetical protein
MGVVLAFLTILLGPEFDFDSYEQRIKEALDRQEQMQQQNAPGIYITRPDGSETLHQSLTYISVASPAHMNRYDRVDGEDWSDHV